MPTTPRYAVSLAALLSLLWGCGGDRFGAPTEPTAAQRRAVSALGEFADIVVRAGQGAAAPEELLRAQILLARLSDEALRRPRPIDLPARSADGFDPRCVQGDAARGFNYDNCRVRGGAMRGQVLRTREGVRFELYMPSPSAAATGYTLQGVVAADASRVVGRLQVATAVETLTVDPALGLTVDRGAPQVTTVTVWDASVADRGLREGSVEVLVSAYGGQEEALFEFEAGAVRVRNSADAL